MPAVRVSQLPDGLADQLPVVGGGGGGALTGWVSSGGGGGGALIGCVSMPGDGSTVAQPAITAAHQMIMNAVTTFFTIILRNFTA
jgi:hypothetical protein